MKGKKIKSLLLIAIFILATLAIAMPVMADPDEFQTGPTGGIAMYTTAGTPPSGSYCVYLSDEGVEYTDQNDYGAGRLVFSTSKLFSAVTTTTYSYYFKYDGPDVPALAYSFPYLILAIDEDGSTTVDCWVVQESGGATYTPGENAWTLMDLSSSGDEFKVHGGAKDGTVDTLANIKSGFNVLATVLEVKIAVGEWWCVPTTAYIDDVKIDALPLYDFETPELFDKARYKTGDTVIVTVKDFAENVRPLVADTIDVEVTSSYPDIITVTLTETGVATGVFTGTFTLYEGTTPSPNELLVDDGETIEVWYLGIAVPDDSALIDNTPPTIAIVSPLEDELIFDNSPLIKANYADAAGTIASAVMMLDSVIVASKSLGTYIEYQVLDYPEEMRLSEGLHTVSVTVVDDVGNIFTKTWTFTVDLVKPTVTVAVEPDPANDIVTFTLTFNEDMGTIEPVVKFGKLSPYTTHIVTTGAWTDLREWKGTYTVTDATGDGLNTISVSAAPDKAGNVMETDTSNTFVIDTVAPTLPEDLVATVTDVSVTIDWTASTDLDGTGVEKYLIDRNDVTGPIAEVTHPITTYVDYSLTVAGSFTYTVTAVDFAGNEAVSAGVLAVFVPGDVIAREIDLYEDWNLISLPMIPEDSDIEVVLENVMAGVEIVWSFDEGNWYRYLPGQPLFSTLHDMEDGKGYWLKMEGADSLVAYGIELPEPPALPPVYPVYVDWNLIGFKSIYTMSITNYFTTIPEDTLDTAVCYRYDAPTQAYELVYLGGELIPTSIPFEPGQGYWLYLVEEANIAPP